MLLVIILELSRTADEMTSYSDEYLEMIAESEPAGFIRGISWELIDKHIVDEDGEEITLMSCTFADAHCTTEVII